MHFAQRFRSLFIFGLSRQSFDKIGFAKAVLIFACISLLISSCTVQTASSLLPSPTPGPFTETTRPSSLHTPSKTPIGTLRPTTKSPSNQTPTKSLPPATVLPETSAALATRNSLGTDFPHPEHTSDLLYLSSGKLMRWDYVTGYTSLLADAVTTYSASSTGKQIALLRKRGITANGVELYELDLLDFETKQIITLIESTSRLSDIVISPDGRWIAYTQNTNGDGVYAIRSAIDNQQLELGKCANLNEWGCGDLSWSPDSQSLLWSDPLGVWISQPEKSVTNLVRSNQVEVVDPKGGVTEVSVFYYSLTWSPNGRYVLTEVVPCDSAVKWRAILDTLSGRLVQVPNSFESAESVSNVGWMVDGNLLVAHAGGESNQSLPFFNLWRILATHDELLIPIKTLFLDAEVFLPELSRGSEKASPYMNWFTQHDTSTLTFGLIFQDLDADSALVTLDLEDASLQKLMNIPNDPVNVLWAPDSSGALILRENSQIIFALMNGGNFYDLRPIIGAEADNFNWLPPMPRS